MSIPDDFLNTLTCPHPKELIASIKAGTAPRGGQIWALQNEVRPVDLFCYLGARFGPPNGIQNLLRRDDSDNLIHWDWTLVCEYGWLSFLGMNFRTELQLLGKFPFAQEDLNDLVRLLKVDFASHGAGMSKIRADVLEKWTEFVNPFVRLKQAISDLQDELNGLRLDPKKDAIADLHLQGEDVGAFESKWKDVSQRYNKGFGLCFGIRSMLPVMAEAFVNLVLFVLLKPEIRTDSRLRDHHVRQPIDIRIRSLHLNCNGFEKPIDYSRSECGRFHSLINERNDLLHGNVAIEKLKFNEVYFHGRVPVFQEYRSMWERSLGVAIRSVGIEQVAEESNVVAQFMEYILSCLEPKVREQMEYILQSRDLGLEQTTGQLGILFAKRLADMRLGPADQRPEESDLDRSK